MGNNILSGSSNVSDLFGEDSMSSFDTFYNNFIAHYGVKEKSGRYPYGSGEDPYQRISRGSLSNKKKKQLISKAKKEIKGRKNASVEMRTKDGGKAKPKEKSIMDMSEDELRQAINRITLQKQYANLLRDLTPVQTKKVENRGKKFVLDLVEKVGSTTLTNLGSGITTYYGGKAANKLFGENIFDIKPMPLSSKKK